ELDTCPSTNTWALEQIQQLPHGAVVFTRRQTQGRGQQGRLWYAPPGVLTASVVLKGLASLAGLSLAAGLAVIYAVEDLLPDCGDRLKLKWPNDVLVDRRKLAGILCEAASAQQVVVGIGLNRAIEFEVSEFEISEFGTSEFEISELGTRATELDAVSVLAGRAISLHQLSRSVPDEIALLRQLRHYLLQVADLFSAGDRASLRSQRPVGLEVLLPALRQRDALLHQPIKLALPQATLNGIAAGIDGRGQLLLQTESLTATESSLRAFSSGRVIWAEA
ncbi:MAG: biotin--[acetyl-CoA-carboxylase] ligase, partial [Elainella sp.]